MTDAKPAARNETSDAAALLAHAADSPADKAVTKFRAEAATEKTGIKPGPKSEPINWRSELQNATTEIKKLEQLKTGDPASAKERHELIDSIDKHFQKALPLVRQDATSADSELLINVARATVSDKDFKSFKVNGKTINPETTKIDDIHNAILNAPDEATRKQLSRLGILAENRDVAMTQVDESYWKSKAPMMAALDYANFLVKHKDGITQDSKGNAFSAGEILNASMTQEMAASPQGKEIMRLAADSMASHQNLLIPSEKNPMLALQEAMSGQCEPKVAMAKLQQASELAKDKYFDPENLKKQIDAAKNDHSPEGPGKLAALQSFTHARALSEAYLGAAEVQQTNGNSAEAFGHLLNAAKDPVAAESLRDGQGHAIYNQLLLKAMSGGEHNLQTAALAYNTTHNETADHAAKYGQLMQAKDYDGAAKELKLASASADETIKNAKAIKDTIGDENGKKIKDEYDALNQKVANKETLKPEEQAMLQALSPYVEAQKYESQAMFSKAKLDMAGDNHNAAVAQLEALQKLDPAFVSSKENQKDFDDILKSAKDGAEYDNAGFLGKAWINIENAPGRAWEFAKEHERMVAGVAALGAAAVITFGTAGLGAPIAIGLGVVGGTLIGTAAGAGTELASGRKDNFLSAAEDVAPSALAGGVTGALLVGLPAVGAGGALDFGTGRAAIFAANSLKGSLIAAPLSLNNAYENYQSGKDKNLASAAFDFASTDLSWGIGGGLMKTPGIAAKIASPLWLVGSSVGGNAGNYYLNRLPLSARFDKNSVTLPDATETPQPEQ
ncbi:MAG: hypothetical protein P4L53_02140 [Candidatus Obscuribacterales bacterium]|nr:hypothetical protein [Candidatus Obscuribacterales bacterium]